MGTWRGEERGAVAGAAGVVAAPCVSLKIKLKKHVLRVIENAFHRKGNYFPPPQNNLTDVFSTVLKHVVNYSQEANGVQVSESVRALRPPLQVCARPARPVHLGWVSVGRRPSRAAPVSLGWGQAPRRRVRCAGRGAGSTVTLEQAGRGAAGSCRFFGQAAGVGLPLQSLVRGRGRDSAVGH